jgi:hypothetical protein
MLVADSPLAPSPKIAANVSLESPVGIATHAALAESTTYRSGDRRGEDPKRDRV